MAIVGDYDVDGFLDLFVVNGFNLRPLQFGGPNRLFRNRGNGKRWLEIDLVGRQSDREATGARVFVTANGVRQVREQNGAYHRWSQDSKRLHFGLAGAARATVRVEWPSGTVQTFNDVAANRLYRITEGNAALAAVTPGGAAPYQCGPPPINAGVDRGVFIWRDCPSGEWRMKTAAAGGRVVFAGSITSSGAYKSVKGVGLNTADSLTRPAPNKIVFRFDTVGKSKDGVNFVPQDGASACLRVDTPAGLQVFYGPFRRPLSQPIDLDTRGSCN
jgi:hypothetical protein